jgi:hypothetical protein
MAKTKEIDITCVSAQITPNGTKSISVSVEEPNVDDLLENIDNDDLTEYVERNFQPEDVFSETILEKWAETNGYVKATESE